MGFVCQKQFIDCREQNQIKERFGEEIYNLAEKFVKKHSSKVKLDVEAAEEYMQTDSPDTPEEYTPPTIQTESIYDRLWRRLKSNK